MKLLISLPFYIAIFLMLSFAADAEVEPNNNLASANPMALNGGENGALSAADVQDWYFITPNGDGNITASVTFAGSLTGFISLITPDNALLVSSAAGGGTISINRTCLTSDTLYIVVQRSTNSGTYTVSNSYAGNLTGNDLEPNNNIASAGPLTNGIYSPGHLGYTKFVGVTGTTDFNDYYQIVTTAGGDISANVIFGAGLTGYVRLLTKDNGNLVLSPTGTGSLSISFGCLAADTYYLQVVRTAGCGGYTVSYTNASPVAINDVEPNNGSADAKPLLPNQMANGGIGYTKYVSNVGTVDQYDWYFFTIPTSNAVSVTANFESSLTGFIRVYNRSLFILQTSSQGTGNLSTSFTCLAADTFYVRVSRTAGCGDYSLNLSVTASGTTQDPEPNSLMSQAKFVAPNGSYNGSLGYLSFSGSAGIVDGTDWYKFAMPADGNIIISATYGANLTGFLSLRTKSNGVLQTTATGSGPFNISALCQSADTFFVAVTRTAGCGGYNLNIQTTSGTFAGDAEPNNAQADAILLPPVISSPGHLGYTSYIGFVGTPDTRDWYRIFPSSDGTVNMTVTFESTVTGHYDLITKDNALLLTTASGTGTITASFSCLTADTYYIRVVHNSGCGGYAVSYNLASATQANDQEPNSTFATANAIALNTPYTGHLGYVTFAGTTGTVDQIDFYSYNIPAPGSYKIEANIQNTITARLTINNSSQGILAQSANASGLIALNYNFTAAGQYFVSVFRDSPSSCGSYQLSIAPNATVCNGVTNQSVTNLSYQSVTLNWNAVSGADHYEIRGRVVGSTAFSYLTIPGGSTTSKNISGLTSNVSYDWQIRAHCDAAETNSSNWSGFFAFTTPSCNMPSPASTSLVTASSARLNWTTKPNATGYEIVGRAVGSSSLVSLTVNGGAINFKDVASLPSGTSFEWAVRTLCSNGVAKSNFTPVQTFTTLINPVKKAALDLENRTLDIYPNPASTVVYVDCSNLTLDNQAQLIVFDMVGKAVIKKQVNESSGIVKIEVHSLPTGSYRIIIKDESENLLQKKFQILR